MVFVPRDEYRRRFRDILDEEMHQRIQLPGQGKW
jgi:hypothetical protein